MLSTSRAISSDMVPSFPVSLGAPWWEPPEPQMEATGGAELTAPKRRLRAKTKLGGPADTGKAGDGAALGAVPVPRRRQHLCPKPSVAIAASTFTAEEEASLVGLPPRQATRERRRLLHNREAATLGQHVLAPWGPGDDVRHHRCMECGGLSPLSKRAVLAWRWPRKQCSSRQAPGLSTTLKNRLAKIVAWNREAGQGQHLFRIPVSMEGPLECTRPGCGLHSTIVQFAKYKHRPCRGRLAAEG